MSSAVWLGSVTIGLAVWLYLVPPVAELRRLRSDAAPGGLHPLSRWLGDRLAWRRLARRRASPDVRAQLPLCLDLLAACVEAGSAVQEALEAVYEVALRPTTEVLAPVVMQLRLGHGEAEAWQELSADPVWGQVARDIGRASAAGTALVLTLRTHALEARRSHAWEQRRRARTVGVRAVLPLGLCFLPAFVLVGLVPIVIGLLQGVLG